MSWVLSCETGISKVPIFFRCGEGNIISCDEWRVWDGPCAVGEAKSVTAWISLVTETPPPETVSWGARHRRLATCIYFFIVRALVQEGSSHAAF